MGRTMPPPELLERSAPASVSELVLQAARREAALPRHGGPHAEEGSMRARLVASQAAGDVAGEREAAIALARLLAARGTDLDAATKLARRALSLGDDAALRVELAGWLAGLGEAGLASATLRSLCETADGSASPDTARTLVKIAVLLARGGDAQGAADALIEASAHDPSDAMAGELLGTLAAWAPELVPPAAAAAAYIEAAARREAQSDHEAAFEDRLRAYELAPADEATARALADTLFGDGRGGAADEVMRAHAAALGATLADGGQAALAVHRARMLIALKAGDVPRAISALLDGNFAADFEGDLALKVDEALSAAGMYELFALRLEVRGLRARTPSARAEAFASLARLAAGPMHDPARAVEAWVEVLANEPASEPALAALRENGAQTGDPSALVEALVRAGETGTGSAAARVAAMRTLVGIADGAFDAPRLAMWALERIGAAGGMTDMLTAELQRHRARAEREDAGLDAAKAAASAATGDTSRIDALRTLAAAHAKRPDDRAGAARALADLAAAQPTTARRGSRWSASPRALLRPRSRAKTPGRGRGRPPPMPSRRSIGRAPKQATRARGHPSRRSCGDAATPREVLRRSRLSSRAPRAKVPSTPRRRGSRRASRSCSGRW